jgi:hypothetical protein
MVTSSDLSHSHCMTENFYLCYECVYCLLFSELLCIINNKWNIYKEPFCHVLYLTMVAQYSLTCIKRSPLGQRKSDLLYWGSIPYRYIMFGMPWYVLQIQALHCEFAEFLLHVGVFK